MLTLSEARVLGETRQNSLIFALIRWAVTKASRLLRKFSWILVFIRVSGDHSALLFAGLCFGDPEFGACVDAELVAHE